MHVLECPTCGRRVEYTEVSEVPQRPFCSHRCRMIDLGKWLDGQYRISDPVETDPHPPRPLDEPPVENA